MFSKIQVKTPLLNVANYYHFVVVMISASLTVVFPDVTGDFVKHYQLQMGDSVTLYEDEFKNLVSIAYLSHNLVTLI